MLGHTSVSEASVSGISGDYIVLLESGNYLLTGYTLSTYLFELSSVLPDIIITPDHNPTVSVDLSAASIKYDAEEEIIMVPAEDYFIKIPSKTED